MVIVAAIILGAGVLTELLAVMGAPLGYQDKNGFHVGESVDDQESGNSMKHS